MSTIPAFDFSGKVVFVSGAASGVGQATAIAFAQAGAWVAVTDNNDDDYLKTVHMIQSSGGEAIFFKCDIGSSDSISSMMSDIIKNMGRIDCAFNNAGIEGQIGDFQDISEQNWQNVMNTNLHSVWLCMKFEIERMLLNQGGSIVNCSSILGLVGMEKSSTYVASKHGVIGLTKSAALEVAAGQTAQ